MAKKVIPISQVRMRAWDLYEYFSHLENKGIIDNLPENEQRIFRYAQANISEICNSDWTANYF